MKEEDKVTTRNLSTKMNKTALIWACSTAKALQLKKTFKDKKETVKKMAKERQKPCKLLMNLGEDKTKIKLKCRKVLKIRILKNKEIWLTSRKTISSVITSFLEKILILINTKRNLTSTLRKTNLTKRVILARTAPSIAAARVGPNRTERQEFATCKRRALLLAPAVTVETSWPWTRSPPQYSLSSARGPVHVRSQRRWIIKIRIFTLTLSVWWARLKLSRASPRKTFWNWNSSKKRRSRSSRKSLKIGSTLIKTGASWSTRKTMRRVIKLCNGSNLSSSRDVAYTISCERREKTFFAKTKNEKKKVWLRKKK